jgi:hypothetical protein
VAISQILSQIEYFPKTLTRGSYSWIQTFELGILRQLFYHFATVAGLKTKQTFLTNISE